MADRYLEYVERIRRQKSSMAANTQTTNSDPYLDYVTQVRSGQIKPVTTPIVQKPSVAINQTPANERSETGNNPVFSFIKSIQDAAGEFGRLAKEDSAKKQGFKILPDVGAISNAVQNGVPAGVKFYAREAPKAVADIASVPENLVRGLGAGADQMVSGAANVGSLGARLITGKNQSPFFDPIRDDFERSAQAILDSAPNGPVGLFARNAAVSVPQIYTTLAGGGALNGAVQKVPLLAKTVGKLPGLLKMLPFSTLAGGQYAREAQQEGANNLQQLGYGAVGGALEGLTEKYMFGNLEDVLAGGKRALTKALINIPFEMGQEAGIDPLTGLAKKGIYKHDMKWYGDGGVVDPKQMWEDAKAGAGTAMLLGGTGLGYHAVASKIAANVTNQLQTMGVPNDQGQADQMANEITQQLVNDTVEEVQQNRTGVPGDAPRKVDPALIESINAASNVNQPGIVPQSPQNGPVPVGSMQTSVPVGQSLNQPRFAGVPGMFTPIAQPTSMMNQQPVRPQQTPVIPSQLQTPLGPVAPVLGQNGGQIPNIPNQPVQPRVSPNTNYQPGQMVVDVKGRVWKVIGNDGTLLTVENDNGTKVQIGVGAIKGRTGETRTVTQEQPKQPTSAQPISQPMPNVEKQTPVHGQPSNDEEIIKRYAKIQADRVMMEGRKTDSYKNASSEEKAKMDANVQNQDWTLGKRKLLETIHTKNVGELLDILTPSANMISRKMFEEVTGIKLGKTQSEIKTGIVTYVGQETYDKHIADRKTAYKAKEEQRQNDAKERELNGWLDSRVRLNLPGGESFRGTMKEAINHLLAKGFTNIKDMKRGNFPTLYLYNDDAAGFEYRKKFQAEYVRKAVEEYNQAHPKTKTVEEEAVESLFKPGGTKIPPKEYKPEQPEVKTPETKPEEQLSQKEIDDAVRIETKGDKQIVTFKYPHDNFSATINADGSYEAFYKQKHLDRIIPGVKKILDQLATKVKDSNLESTKPVKDAKQAEPVYNEAERVLPLPSDPKEVDPEHFNKYVKLVGKAIGDIHGMIIDGTFPKGARVQSKLRDLVSDELGRKATEDEVTDIIETAVQKYIWSQIEGLSPEAAIKKAYELEKELLPSFSRSIEKTERQQFSTPTAIAYAAANIANVTGGKVLEPTAGTGSLLEGIKSKGDIATVEMEPRRAAILKAQGYDVINDSTFNHMPKVPYDTVIMNPPFRGASRMHDDEKTGKPPWSGGWGDLGNRFVAFDLMRRLKKGGRLVSVVSPGVVDALNKTNIPFRVWLKKNYAVRAMIVLPSGTYDTRGTSFGSGLLVIDKIPPDGTAPIIGKPENWEEFFEMMKGVKDRVKVEPNRSEEISSAAGTGTSTESATSNGTGNTPAGGNNGHRGSTSVDSGGVRGGGNGSAGNGHNSISTGTNAKHTNKVSVDTETGGISGNVSKGDEVSPEGKRGLQPAKSDEVKGDLPRRSAETVAGDTGSDAADGSGTDITAGNFVSYKPEKVSGRKSPGDVCEPPTLALVSAPKYLEIDPKLMPHPKIMKGGKGGEGLADIQLECVMAAKYNHQHNRGMLIGDDVGVGKTGSILGILGDGWYTGEYDRQVFVINSETFIKTNLKEDPEKFGIDDLPFIIAHGNADFKESTDDVAANKADKNKVVDFKKFVPKDTWKPLPAGDGILIVTKEDMVKYSYAVYDWLKQSKKSSRVVVDEAHYFKHIPANEVDLGAAQRAMCIKNLWRDLKPDKKTQFIYCTATSGESLEDIEYLYDLGMWDTSSGSFAKWKQDLMGGSFEDNVGRRSKSDPYARAVPLALMEQIIRELKINGQYFGRMQKLTGVEVEAIPVQLDNKRIGQLNSIIDFVNLIGSKIQTYGGNRFGIMGQLLQYMRRNSGQYRLEAALKDAKRRYEEGLANGEPIRIIFSVDNFNATPKAAPIIQTMIGKVPLAEKTPDGDFVEIPEAKYDQDELFAILYDQNPEYPCPLQELPSLVEQIQDVFGKDKVGLITGTVTAGTKSAALKQYHSMEKPIVVLSKAGASGFNMQDTTGNRVVFYHIDYDYDATTFKQREGRGNRMGQKTAPLFVYPYIEGGLDTRFIGTIMARNEQMGAIARGKAGDVSSDDLKQFNVSGNAAKVAVARTLLRLTDEDRNTMLGMSDTESEGYERKVASFSAKDFMNRLMFLHMDQSMVVRDIFMEELNNAKEEMSSVNGISDSFNSYRGKVVEETNAAGGVKMYKIKNTDQGEVERATKQVAKSENDLDEANKKLEKAKEETKANIETRKKELSAVIEKLEAEYRKVTDEYLKCDDPKTSEKLEKKRNGFYAKMGDCRERLNRLEKPYGQDEDDFLSKFTSYARALAKVRGAKLSLENAKNNQQFAEQAVLIEGQIVTGGLMGQIRTAIHDAKTRLGLPTEGKIEFRGYVTEDGKRLVGLAIPDWATEDVAEAIGAKIATKALSKDEIWKRLTEQKREVKLRDGVSMKWNEYQKGVLVYGIRSTDPAVKDWYLNSKPDIAFQPVSRAFMVANQKGMEKVLKQWPLAVDKLSAIDEADAEIEQRLNESGSGFRQGNSNSTAIAAGTFHWLNRVKNAINDLFGDDSNKVTVSDVQVEKMLTATKSPLNLKQQLRSAIHGVTTSFKDVFEYEWTVKAFPQFQDELRRFKGVSRDAQKFALDKLVKITAFLETSKEYEIFRRLVFLRDLQAGIREKEAKAFAAAKRMGYDVEEVNEMEIKTTGELTGSQIEKAIKELWGQTSEHTQKRIEDALWAHDRTFTALWENLKERGKVPENSKHQESYVPHRVLDYMGEVDKRFPVLSRRFKTPYRYYLNKRTGSTRLIDTDYTALTMKHFAKLYMDNAYDDFNMDIAAKYDKYIQMEKENRKELGKLTPGRLYEVDGEQYRAWQFDPGRNYYLQESLTEDTVMQILQDVLDPELKPEDRQLMFEAAMSQAMTGNKKFLAVGKYKRIYLLPVALADRLTYFKSPDYNSRVLNAIRSFHHYYKMVLFSPVTLGIPFHVNNAFGDAINLFRDDPEAFKYMKDAWQAVSEWQSGLVGPRFLKVVEIAEKYRVAESALMKNSEMPFHPQLKKLQPKRYIGRSLNPLTKWNDLAERRELTPRFAKLMADLARIERGEMPVAHFLDVEKLVKAGMSTEEVAGKLAREVTVDYDKLTSEGKLILRDIGLPFFTFYAENFGNWFKYVKRNPGNFAAKFMIPLLAMILWNWLRFPDEEDKLPLYYRVAPHIITGFKGKDGKMIIWSMQTPVEMAGRIIGLDVFPDLVRQVASGKKSVDKAALELAKSVALGPAEAAKDLLTPLFKAPIEAFGNKSWFNGRPVVPKQLQGTAAEWKVKAKYIIGQWFTPVGNWSRNTKDDLSIQKGIGSYLRKGPVDVGRAFGIRHVDAGREQISRFYERLEQLEGDYRLWKNKRQKGQKQLLFKGYFEMKALQKYSGRFSKLWKQVKLIEDSKMSEMQQDKLNKRIVDGMAKMAETALKTTRK